MIKKFLSLVLIMMLVVVLGGCSLPNIPFLKGKSVEYSASDIQMYLQEVYQDSEVVSLNDVFELMATDDTTIAEYHSVEGDVINTVTAQATPVNIVLVLSNKQEIPITLQFNVAEPEPEKVKVNINDVQYIKGSATSEELKPFRDFLAEHYNEGSTLVPKEEVYNAFMLKGIANWVEVDGTYYAITDDEYNFLTILTTGEPKEYSKSRKTKTYTYDKLSLQTDDGSTFRIFLKAEDGTQVYAGTTLLQDVENTSYHAYDIETYVINVASQSNTFVFYDGKDSYAALNPLYDCSTLTSKEYYDQFMTDLTLPSDTIRSTYWTVDGKEEDCVLLADVSEPFYENIKQYKDYLTFVTNDNKVLQGDTVELEFGDSTVAEDTPTVEDTTQPAESNSDGVVDTAEETVPSIKPVDVYTSYAEKYPNIYKWPASSTTYSRWIMTVDDQTTYVGSIIKGATTGESPSIESNNPGRDNNTYKPTTLSEEEILSKFSSNSVTLTFSDSDYKVGYGPYIGEISDITESSCILKINGVKYNAFMTNNAYAQQLRKKYTGDLSMTLDSDVTLLSAGTVSGPYGPVEGYKIQYKSKSGILTMKDFLATISFGQHVFVMQPVDGYTDENTMLDLIQYCVQPLD